MRAGIRQNGTDDPHLTLVAVSDRGDVIANISHAYAPQMEVQTGTLRCSRGSWHSAAATESFFCLFAAISDRAPSGAVLRWDVSADAAGDAATPPPLASLAKLYSADEGSVTALEWEPMTRCAYFVTSGYQGAFFMQLCAGSGSPGAVVLNASTPYLFTLAWTSALCKGGVNASAVDDWVSPSSSSSSTTVAMPQLPVQWIHQGQYIVGLSLPSGNLHALVPVTRETSPAALVCSDSLGLLGITPPSVVSVHADGSMQPLFTGQSYIGDTRPDLSAAWLEEQSTLAATLYQTASGDSVVWAADIASSTSSYAAVDYTVTGLAVVG